MYEYDVTLVSGNDFPTQGEVKTIGEKMRPFLKKAVDEIGLYVEISIFQLNLEDWEPSRYAVQLHFTGELDVRTIGRYIPQTLESPAEYPELAGLLGLSDFCDMADVAAKKAGILNDTGHFEGYKWDIPSEDDAWQQIEEHEYALKENSFGY